MNRVYLVLSLYCFAWQKCLCQKPPTQDSVWHLIRALQSENDRFYNDGLFPSQRSWFYAQGDVEDDNIFMTASLLFTLQSIADNLPYEALHDALRQKALSNYENYYSRRGDSTYNFWQTRYPDLPFPNGGAFLSKESYRLPDDYDVTALIGLTIEENEMIDRIHLKMKRYAHKHLRSVSTPYWSLSYRPYGVWFAKKMDQEYDISVMCNTLSFLLYHGFSLDQTAQETASLLRQLINTQQYLDRPENLSPYYPSTALIIYHLARLISLDREGIFQESHLRLIPNIQVALQATDSEMEKMLLYIAWLKLSREHPLDTPFIISISTLKKELATFPFFQFKPKVMLGVLPNMTWTCRALNLSFLLEFLVLCEASQQTIDWNY